MSNSAADFSTSTAYTAGDLCLYGGKLYIFTSSHSAGAWDDDDAEAYDKSLEAYDKSLEGDINRVLAGYNNAMNAAGFVDTVVFGMSQVTGTRYKFTATNAADPRN